MTFDANDQQAKNAHYRAALQAYAERVSAGDAARICELFADDAEIEDPVGGPMGVMQGKAAVRAFYDAVVAAGVKLEVAGHICGSRVNRAILPLRVTIKHVEIHCLSLATFDDAGKIVRYEAHWGAGDYTPADRDPLELLA